MKRLPLAIGAILAVGVMVLWKAYDIASPSGPVDHERHHDTASNLSEGPSDAAEVGSHDAEGRRNEKPSKLKDPASPNSAPPHSQDIQAFGENGQITTQAIENLDLTSDEVASLTKLLTTVKEQAAADFVSRTKLTENFPAANGAFRHTYFVKARPDRGMEFSTALAKGAESLIGAPRAQRIKSSISSLDYLGGGGKYDLNIVVSSDGDEKAVKYELIDPKGGAVISVQECSYKIFAETFGDVFGY